tara:strand:- start:236 stop:637 length:402 start_codon:yes stop_codon:yes gene_type:complete
MKYCQGPKCHTYHTKDRIRGSKGDKHYTTRKRSEFNYMSGNCCSYQCQSDWFDKFGNMALNQFGRIHEPKRTNASASWYKEYKYVRNQNYNSPTRYNHFLVNDLLGTHIPITEEQYNNTSTKNINQLVNQIQK